MTSLQLHINEIPNLALADAIQAIIDLTPGLTTSVSPKGKYIIHHADYEGPANLNDLGGHYLACGRRCTDEHAPSWLRLRHETLDDVFDKLYGPPYEALIAGIEDGSITLPEPGEDSCCGVCAGHPDSVILSGLGTCEAFYYEEEEYRCIFGENEGNGSRMSATESWIKASKEQVEEAARDLEASTKL